MNFKYAVCENICQKEHAKMIIKDMNNGFVKSILEYSKDIFDIQRLRLFMTSKITI